MKQLFIALSVSLLLLGCQKPEDNSVENTREEEKKPTKNLSSTPLEQNLENNKQWIAGWLETSALSHPRAGAATVTHNGHIYVIGGVDGRQFLRTTEFAKVLPDGGLGPWQKGSSLIEERGFVEAAVYGNYVYVVGGGNGPNGKNLLQSVERAEIRGDGSLGPWQTEQNSMITPRRCSKVFIVGQYLYSLGGFAGALLDTVERAAILDDGHLGPWRIEQQTMTMPRYVNSAKVAGENSYVIGGHDQSKGVGIVDVEWASPASDGSVADWKKTSPMQEGRYGLSSVYQGGFVYALGGLTGLEYLRSIEYAAIKSDGGLSAWRFTTEMSEPRATFSSVVYKNRIYLIGGTNQDRYLSSVEYATFKDEGEIGFWGTAEQHTAYQQRSAKLLQTKSQLPNEGTVTHFQHASMYTYLHVNSNLGAIWLAGPKTELAKNDRVKFSKGVSMSNFYSKELQQQFPVILFVSKIEKVNN